ncbi:MAG: hypothetical protein R3F21_13075 [Myxococcota bacterium]
MTGGSPFPRSAEAPLHSPQFRLAPLRLALPRRRSRIPSPARQIRSAHSWPSPARSRACQACGAAFRWHGRCPDCGAWDSLVEESFAAPRAAEATAARSEGLARLARCGRRRREAAAPLGDRS